MDSFLRRTREKPNFRRRNGGFLHPYHMSNQRGETAWQIRQNSGILEHLSRNFGIFEMDAISKGDCPSIHCEG